MKNKKIVTESCKGFYAFCDNNRWLCPLQHSLRLILLYIPLQVEQNWKKSKLGGAS